MYKRLILLGPSDTEFLNTSNAQDNLVEVTRYCDFPKETLQNPRIGGWLDIEEELVLKNKSDLLLASSFVQHKIIKKYMKRT